MPVMPKAKAKSLMGRGGKRELLMPMNRTRCKVKACQTNRWDLTAIKQKHIHTNTHMERKRDSERHTRVQQSLDLRKTSKVH